MFWISLLIFSSFLFGCWAPDQDDKELNPLNIPDDIKMDEDQSLMNMFKNFNINYLRNKFKPPSKESSIPQRLKSTAVQFLDSYKNLYKKNKYPNVCEWKREGLKRVAKVTEKGDQECSEKCKAENDEYVEYANNKLPHLFNILNMPNLKAKFEATDEDLHECVPGFLYGFTCVCKHQVKALVNEGLQALIDEVFETQKTKEGGAGGETAEEKKENKNKSNVVGRFFGLFAVLMYFPSWLYSYIVWWTYASK